MGGQLELQYIYLKAKNMKKLKEFYLMKMDGCKMASTAFLLLLPKKNTL